MTDDPRVQELLVELLASHATPEEVCATCPELLPLVRNRWRQMRRLHADLDAHFPPPDLPSTTPDALVSPPETTPRPPVGWPCRESRATRSKVSSAAAAWGSSFAPG